MSRIRVLVVDDSALMRKLLTEILSRDESIEVVGAAADPYYAWSLVQTENPDVLTLDVEMPQMDGLEFLERLMRARPLPVVMVSALTQRGGQWTLKALELGAIDYVAKPKLDEQRSIDDVGDEICAKVKMAARSQVRTNRPVVQQLPPTSPGPANTDGVAGLLLNDTNLVLAIGASTGGTEAIREVLLGMAADAPGIVVVQHMPEHFTRAFAERLDSMCAMHIKEAADGDPVVSGSVLIAPGGTQHMRVHRSGDQYIVRLSSEPPRNHHRPSVDVLFESCAQNVGKNAVGVLLTGMGEDGAQGLLAMRRAGARTIAEHESTCVVYGMPRAAVELGAVTTSQPPPQIASTMLRFANSLVSRGE
jgi:two-component system chemotaxis response regulator CheB